MVDAREPIEVAREETRTDELFELVDTRGTWLLFLPTVLCEKLDVVVLPALPSDGFERGSMAVDAGLRSAGVLPGGLIEREASSFFTTGN